MWRGMKWTLEPTPASPRRSITAARPIERRSRWSRIGYKCQAWTSSGAETMRVERERVARRYGVAVRAAGISDLVELPEDPAPDEVHAWHLYPIRFHLD